MTLLVINSCLSVAILLNTLVNVNITVMAWKTLNDDIVGKRIYLLIPQFTVSVLRDVNESIVPCLLAICVVWHIYISGQEQLKTEKCSSARSLCAQSPPLISMILIQSSSLYLTGAFLFKILRSREEFAAFARIAQDAAHLLKLKLPNINDEIAVKDSRATTLLICWMMTSLMSTISVIVLSLANISYFSRNELLRLDFNSKQLASRRRPWRYFAFKALQKTRKILGPLSGRSKRDLLVEFDLDEQNVRKIDSESDEKEEVARFENAHSIILTEVEDSDSNEDSGKMKPDDELANFQSNTSTNNFCTQIGEKGTGLIETRETTQNCITGNAITTPKTHQISDRNQEYSSSSSSSSSENSDTPLVDGEYDDNDLDSVILEDSGQKLSRWQKVTNWLRKTRQGLSKRYLRDPLKIHYKRCFD